MHSGTGTKPGTNSSAARSPVSRLVAGIEMLGGVAGGNLVGGFLKQMGLSASNTPQVNAARMADSLHARMDAPETPGKFWRRGPTLRRREVMRKPDELSKCEGDEDLIDLINSSEPFKLQLRTIAETWMAGVDEAEHENACRLRMLVWCVELYDFADPEGTSELRDRRDAAGRFCWDHYKIDAANPPPEYANSTGPWKLVRHCRRYDVLSKQVRAREMFKAPMPREDWGGGG